MSVGTRRVCAWMVGTLCLIIIVGLIVTAVFDLQIGDSTSSVIIGVTAVIGLAISTITLIMNSANTPTGSSAAMPARIRSKGRGALAAGGSIRGNALGKNAKVIGPMSAAPPTAAPATPGSDVSARGTGAMSAGGDIADNAVGEESER
jgi:hypothetical protein